jgi:hypothetical protein
MYAVGRFFRWLFLDPIREAVFFSAVVVIASSALAGYFLNPNNVPSGGRRRPGRGSAAANPCETQGKSTGN